MPKILRTEKVKVTNVIPYPGNARRGNVEGIRESLRTHGQYRPIVVQDSTSYILAGNHTWQAVVAEGWDEIEVTFIEATDEEARKILLADNKYNDHGSYDNSELAGLLRSLGGDYTGTGFDDSEVTKLLDSLDSGSPDDDDDPEPEPPRDPVTEPGDGWVLGEHRLVCGSASEAADVFTLMNGDLANLIVTSPPYNQQLDSFKPSGMQKENPAWVERMGSAYSDSLPEEEYQDDQVHVFNLLWEATADDGALFYNHKHRYREKQVVSPLQWLTREDFQWRWRQEIIWDRGGSITLNARMFMPSDERIYWMTKSDRFVFNDTTEVKSYSTIWQIAARVEIRVSAPFPIELPLRCIQAASNRGDIVVDPYGGSGTTLMACEQLGRKARLIELNPAYCDVIVQRWEKATGRKAERIEKAVECGF